MNVDIGVVDRSESGVAAVFGGGTIVTVFKHLPDDLVKFCTKHS